MTWTKGRGLLGPLKPLLGAWVSEPGEQQSNIPARCTRVLRPFGQGWIELDARWEISSEQTYREIALFGAMPDGGLGFYSFTNDGKKSEGRLAEALDLGPQAIAFEAAMPAGLARMAYWPLHDGEGFNFTVESRSKTGWNRFLRHVYRRSTPP
jgi:hypothetical protein